MNKKLTVIGGAILSSVGLCSAQNSEQAPNIIVILADDLGFSDLGCYGGEIKTPNLDGLADSGLRLTQMYNSARSCPTRASLLTGLYPHQTGLGHMDNNPKWPKGYSGFRNDSDNVTIAEVLRQSGYYTAMSGKLHLGNQTRPIKRGFDDYYGLVGGFNSFWDPSVYKRYPVDGSQIEYKEQEFYATDAITDYAISFANKAKELNKPMFLYLAYNAPHFPLHAPKEVTDKYMETYMQGWDSIRIMREEKVKELGIIEGDYKASGRGDVAESMRMDETYPIPAWCELSADEQTDLARRMAIFAAMVDIMDQNIGRLLKHLEQNDMLDNTFILFTSDNGACAEWHEHGFDFSTGVKYHIHTGNELDSMGLLGTYHHYGTGWANVGNTPLSLYKHFAHEGGISSPTVMWWGDKLQNKGAIDHTPLNIVDIMATCVDLAGAQYPAKYHERDILPMEGISFLPLARGGQLDERAIFAEHEGNRMVRKGDWKLVSAQYKSDVWELYNIVQDRTEQNNLASQHPEMVEQLAKEYHTWATRCDVLPFAETWNSYSNPALKRLKINN